MTERPNILCLVSEDCPPRLGAYGDTIARTPNLDALAARGATWNIACSTAPVCAPSRFAILTGRHAPSVPPAQHMSTIAPLPPHIATYPQVMRAAGYYCTNNSKTHYNCDVDPHAIWDESSDTAHWRNRPSDRPFLAVFNCMTTHESCVFRESDGPVQAADVAIPPYLPDTPGMHQSLAIYYNNIERMDRFMGERLAELEAEGVSDDTIIIYYSDHGSPLPRSKRFCYDEGLRVPFIVHVPAKWRHLLPVADGSVVRSPVSLVDLFPTFASLAGVEPPDGLHGQPFLGPARKERRYAFSARDRMDEHYDMVRTARSDRFRYIRNYAPHRIWGQHYAFAWEGVGYQDYEQAHFEGILNDMQGRFWGRKPAEELYDAATDPHSVNNLAADPAHAETLSEMRAALDAHLLLTRDAGFVPEADLAERPPNLDNPAIYPVAKVMDLAWTAIQRDPANISDFISQLSDQSQIVRYWAAQGLLMLAVEGHKLPEDLRTALDDESNVHVQIALMETLGHVGEAREWVARLIEIVRSTDNDRQRLQALGAIGALPLQADISLDLMTELAEDQEEYVRGVAGYLKLNLEQTYTPVSRVFRFDLFRAAMAQSTARRA